jgi:hypothetical protein
VTRRSNKEILNAAKTGIEPIAALARRREQRPGIREGVQHMLTVNDGRIPAHLLQYPYLRPTHPEFPDVLATIRDCAIFRLWTQSKVVYAMDDDLLGYLSESSASSIPTEILRGLPHANPYVLLPRPDLQDPQTAYYRTHIGVPWGAFVFGRYRDAQLMCSTRDERREDLGLMFVGLLETEYGADLQTVRCTVPLREPMITVHHVVNATVAGFEFNEHLAEDDRAKLEVWLHTYVGQVFNSLVYICTDQQDVETYRPGVNKAGKVKKSGRRQQRRPRSSDINEIVQLGFRLGPALNEARRRREREQTQPALGTGARQPPHRRRGHFHTYWTGPGRKVPKVNWVAPYWVSQDLLERSTSLTVVVRRVKKRP